MSVSQGCLLNTGFTKLLFHIDTPLAILSLFRVLKILEPCRKVKFGLRKWELNNITWVIDVGLLCVSPVIDHNFIKTLSK